IRKPGSVTPFGAEAARAAAQALRSRIPSGSPVAAIVLGSGLGSLAEEIESAVVVPYGDIGGFPAATVAGHAGALIAGRLVGKPVIALARRLHLFEGHVARCASFPARPLPALGPPG